MFNSSASAPASSIDLAYRTQPPLDDPFKLPMMGIDRLRLASSIVFR
jgi:hypothetical protein